MTMSIQYYNTSCVYQAAKGRRELCRHQTMTKDNGAITIYVDGKKFQLINQCRFLILGEYLILIL